MMPLAPASGPRTTCSLIITASNPASSACRAQRTSVGRSPPPDVVRFSLRIINIRGARVDTRVTPSVRRGDAVSGPAVGPAEAGRSGHLVEREVALDPQLVEGHLLRCGEHRDRGEEP